MTRKILRCNTDILYREPIDFRTRPFVADATQLEHIIKSGRSDGRIENLMSVLVGFGYGRVQIKVIWEMSDR